MGSKFSIKCLPWHCQTSHCGQQTSAEWCAKSQGVEVLQSHHQAHCHPRMCCIWWEVLSWSQELVICPSFLLSPSSLILNPLLDEDTLLRLSTFSLLQEPQFEGETPAPALAMLPALSQNIQLNPLVAPSLSKVPLHTSTSLPALSFLIPLLLPSLLHFLLPAP